MRDEPTLEAIRSTREKLASRILETPVRLWQDRGLERVVGRDTKVFLKEELFQHTGSFKPRGALAVMLDLDAQALARGVTAVSAGNHAMAVAYAARALGTSARVVMPKTANPFRVQACRELGAEVELVEDVHRAFERVAQRMLRQLHVAAELRDLASPPGNRLEALHADRAGQHSIRINDQWRICFVWRDGDAYDVEIVDYH